MIFDKPGRHLRVFGVAFIITIEELRLDFSQIVHPIGLQHKRAEWLRAGASCHSPG